MSGTVAEPGGLVLCPRSPAEAVGTTFSLVREGRSRFLAVRGERGGFERVGGFSACSGV